VGLEPQDLVEDGAEKGWLAVVGYPCRPARTSRGLTQTRQSLPQVVNAAAC
jgi:hypothetical protein